MGCGGGCCRIVPLLPKPARICCLVLKGCAPIETHPNYAQKSAKFCEFTTEKCPRQRGGLATLFGKVAQARCTNARLEKLQAPALKIPKSQKNSCRIAGKKYPFHETGPAALFGKVTQTRPKNAPKSEKMLPLRAGIS